MGLRADVFASVTPVSTGWGLINMLCEVAEAELNPRGSSFLNAQQVGWRRRRMQASQQADQVSSNQSINLFRCTALCSHGALILPAVCLQRVGLHHLVLLTMCCCASKGKDRTDVLGQRSVKQQDKNALKQAAVTG